LSGPAMVVIGLGLNVCLSPAQRSVIDQHVSDLASVCREPPTRNATAGAVVKEIVSALEAFRESGFAPFREQWQQADFLKGRNIKLHINNTAVEGLVQGVDENGLLKLLVGREEQTHFAGHVELLD
jgi:BirA family biotin operon repressor/biotin-[acetyl-CoA-carboxylase] ligase